jgi:hypothetical protein
MRLPPLMPRLLFALALAFQCLLAGAAPPIPLEVGASWPGLTLPDQHDKTVTLAADKLRVALFAAERKPGDWAQEVIDKTHKETATAGRLVLVLDISRMPSLVTTMFALPSFRGRAFPILVARDAAPVAFLPRQEAAVTVLTFAAGKLVAIDYAKDEATLERLIAQQLTHPNPKEKP